MRTRTQSQLRILLTTIVAGALFSLVVGVGSAAATPGWWILNSASAPTILVPGQEGEIIATAVNAGYEPVSGAGGKTIVLKDTLPKGLEITHITAEAGPDLSAEQLGRNANFLTCTVESRTVSCPYTGSIEETESIRAQIFVKVSKEAEGEATNIVAVTGGNSKVNPEPLAHPVQIREEATKFGVERYELRPEDSEGNIDTQAGSHPFQLTTIFNLTEGIEEHQVLGKGVKEKFPTASALPKDLHFVLPPGLIGKAAHVPRCSGANFATLTPGDANLCPPNTAIGYAIVTANDPVIVGYFEAAVPVFNITPSPGEPARFGFEDHDVPVVLTTKVLSGKSYAIEVTVHEATQAAAVLASQVTLWGVPEDPRHDAERGWECLEKGWYLQGERQCEPKDSATPEAFLTMPTACQTVASERESTVTGEAWNGEAFGLAEASTHFTFTPFTGCEKLPFDPSIEVTPDHATAATPSGLTVKIKVPQETTLSGKEGVYGEADIKSTTLALPEGVQASGGAADGLLTCSSSGFGFEGVESELERLGENNHFNQNPVDELECPNAAKIGTVAIDTPLLEEQLKGSVYLASADTNPFGSPLMLYIFAESETSHVQVKLAGEVQLGPTGQLISVFKNTPPVPFSQLTLHLFDGARASQSTPETCGEYPSVGTFTASSGTVRQASSTFDITSGAGGAACSAPGTQPFAPGFEAKSDSPQAGAFSPFTVTIERPDGDQGLKRISVTEPPGAAAMLSSVTPCPIADALAAVPSCPESSRIGESVALAGLGEDPVRISGIAYLTGPYKGAPFGLLDVTDATKVGPFNLGYIPVMSTINVDQTTAQAIVTSDPLPQFVKGVPSQIKKLVIDVNRPGFTFNPTNCSPLAVTGTLTGYGPAGSEGAEAVSSPYHAANCDKLPFKPTVTVGTEANYSRVDGLGMKIVVTSGKGQANIKKTKLVFPSSLPSRLTTIQKACLAAVFAANPANCPEGSVIGTGVAHTPVLKTPLTGPAYLVSHGGAAFPDAEFVLQSEGIKLILDGKTNISKGITSSTFDAVPDAPVETFEVTLPRGPHSAFSGFGNLCSKALNMPTEFGGQNGALIEETTKISVKNCGGVLPSKVESKLAKALKACKKVKGKKKRASCEAKARKKYGAKKKSKKTAKHK